MEKVQYQTRAPVLHFVDDDDNWTYLFCDQFEKMAPEWEIICARDGISAKHQLACSSAPRVLVTDIDMPGMDGLQLAEWVKGKTELRSIPLFVFSNSTDPSRQQRCADLGVDRFIEKPTSMKDLRQAIRSIVKHCEENMPAPAEPVLLHTAN